MHKTCKEEDFLINASHFSIWLGEIIADAGLAITLVSLCNTCLFLDTFCISEL